MIKVKEAQEIIGGFSREAKVEIVGLFDSLGRVLAENISSETEMPPFNKSAMDGYALSKSDSSEKFRICETIAAGQISEAKIVRGECVKIMTGAPLPKGTDLVIKKELTLEENGFMSILEREDNDNVCRKGEDVKIGDLILQKGNKITAQQVGIMASVGCARIRVYKKPIIGIVTTGSEIAEPGQVLKPGQIYNSNSYSIGAQYLNYGCEIRYDKSVVDNKSDIKKSIGLMLKTADVIVISGGVSMGDFDFVPQVLRELGVKIRFEKIAVKPGKPTVFGTLGNKAVFGLPGNPVSTFVINEVFVKPLIFKLMGFLKSAEQQKYFINWHYSRVKGSRTNYIPVRLEGRTVKKIDYHGSAHIRALAKADALMEIEQGVLEIREGTEVNVRLI
jgi:molybdopterin molybdotransferase